jgi:hypothetical protein
MFRYQAKTIGVKLKSSDFSVKTRAKTLAKATRNREDIFACASKLLTAEMPMELRLLGVRVSSLLDDGDEDEEDDADRGIRKVEIALCTFVGLAPRSFCLHFSSNSSRIFFLLLFFPAPNSI